MVSIERKALWDGQPTNTRRNPNFRKNQNQNTRKNGLDQNIRPPFQENYVEASNSDQPVEDTQTNLMGLNNEGEVFLTQDDQEAHILKQFQTQSSESFDFKEGYDTTIYEVHKEYNLRSRRNYVPKTNKQETSKQPMKGKTITTPIHILSISDPNPSNPIIEDVFHNQPNNRQPSTSPPPKGNVEEPPEVDLGETSNHNLTPQKGKNTENRENPTI